MESSSGETLAPVGHTWPRITIVTPSYNQGSFIEETIRSVLLQGYPNLEYIIIDGGSSDDSVALVSRYSEWLSFWVSEPDNGQAAAINKGFKKASGDIWQWINSDDRLAPGALFRVAHLYMTQPATIIAGACENFWPDGQKIATRNQSLEREALIAFFGICNLKSMQTEALKMAFFDGAI